MVYLCVETKKKIEDSSGAENITGEKRIIWIYPFFSESQNEKKMTLYEISMGQWRFASFAYRLYNTIIQAIHVLYPYYTQHKSSMNIQLIIDDEWIDFRII